MRTGLSGSALVMGLFAAACSQETFGPETDQPLRAPSFAVSALATCGAPSGGLLAWWPGEGNADDVQGPPFYDAAMTSGASFDLGKVGQAFSFDGVDDWVRIAVNGFPVANEFTIAAWIWIDGTGPQPTPNWRTIYADNALGFWIYNEDPIESGGQGFVISWWQSGLNRIEGNTEIPPGEWHHVALTYSNSSDVFTAYLDGAFDGVSAPFAGASLPGPSGLGIGRHAGASGLWTEPFKGLIDEVRVYDRALTASEVQTVACVTPEARVEAMQSEVLDLIDSGAIDEGNGNALLATLDNILKSLSNDKPNVPNLLNAFINKVEGFVNGGILTPEEGQALIAAAQAIIDQL